MTPDQKEWVLVLAQAGVITIEDAIVLLRKPWWRRAIDWVIR